MHKIKLYERKPPFHPMVLINFSFYFMAFIVLLIFALLNGFFVGLGIVGLRWTVLLTKGMRIMRLVGWLADDILGLYFT